MSKVASITISTKSRQKSSSDLTPVSPTIYKIDDGLQQRDGSEERPARIASSDSEEDKHTRRKSSGSSPERKLSSQRHYDTYDQERGLMHTGRSRKMSSKQRTLERELNTTGTSHVSSRDDGLTSSDDGLEDSFIPRTSSETYYMVKYRSDSDEGQSGSGSGSGSVYEKKNIEPPRAKSQPTGNRVQSATGKLFDNYEKDQSFENHTDGGNIEKPKTSVSVLKAAYSQKPVESKPVERYKVDEELEQIRYTMQNRGMMEGEEDVGVERNHAEPEVMYRKPLSSIKDKFLAAASGRKIESSSDSEDDHAEKKNNKEDIVASSQPVVDIRKHWHEKGKWEDRKKVDAFEDIDASHVGSARSAFKQLENRRDVISVVNKPRGNKISDPNSIMQERRHKTYGDESEVDGVIRHEGQDELATLQMDMDQIKAAKSTFKMIESPKEEQQTQVRRPSMKLIKEEDVSKTMNEHRRKVSAEDFDDYAEHIKPNGTAQHLVNGGAA